jgi:hypothetical protein
MAGGRPPLFNSFACPNCKALYQAVKVEAGPETDDRAISVASAAFRLQGERSLAGANKGPVVEMKSPSLGRPGL